MLTGRDHEEQEQEEPLNKIPRLRQEKFSVLTPWLVWLGIFFYDSMSGSLISKAGGLRIGSVCKFSLHPEECSTMYRMGQNRKKY